MTVRSTDVADFFIWRARETGEAITHLKLQKLVYYAQAWFLALNDEPLMDTRFEAWVHGPVCRELYGRFRGYAWQPITEDVQEPDLDAKTTAHLKEVWEVYGGFSALDLERMTHDEAPWQIARGELSADEACDAAIPEDTMRDYYQSRLA